MRITRSLGIVSATLVLAGALVPTTPAHARGLSREAIKSRALDYAFVEFKPTALTRDLIPMGQIGLDYLNLPDSTPAPVQELVEIIDSAWTTPLFETEVNTCRALESLTFEPVDDMLNVMFANLDALPEKVLGDLEARYSDRQLESASILALKSYTLALIDSATTDTCPSQRANFETLFGVTLK